MLSERLPGRWSSSGAGRVTAVHSPTRGDQKSLTRVYAQRPPGIVVRASVLQHGEYLVLRGHRSTSCG